MKENFAIIFDLDGTLANTIPSICKALADAFKNFNIQPPTKESLYKSAQKEEFMSMFGTTEYGILKIHCPEKSEELFAEYLRLYALYTSEESPKAFDGIIPILQKLENANIPMALVTGKSLASAYYSIGKYNLDGFFDYVEIGGDTSSVKTIRIKAILERWKKPLGNIYYLGDSPHDVDEAKAIQTAIDAVTDGLVRVFKGNDEITDLDAEIEISEGDVFTFVRLTMLSGRMW